MRGSTLSARQEAHSRRARNLPPSSEESCRSGRCRLHWGCCCALGRPVKRQRVYRSVRWRASCVDPLRLVDPQWSSALEPAPAVTEEAAPVGRVWRPAARTQSRLGGNAGSLLCLQLEYELRLGQARRTSDGGARGHCDDGLGITIATRAGCGFGARRHPGRRECRRASGQPGPRPAAAAASLAGGGAAAWERRGTR
jgi:hypothetical protein